MAGVSCNLRLLHSFKILYNSQRDKGEYLIVFSVTPHPKFCSFILPFLLRGKYSFGGAVYQMLPTDDLALLITFMLPWLLVESDWCAAR